MSETHFDISRTSKALSDHLAGWFGVGQACASEAGAGRSPIVRSIGREAVKPCGCGGAASTPCGSTSDPGARDIAAQLVAEQQRGREMERVLAQYVSPQVLERLMADPAGLSLGGEKRDVTVLFADLSGFTALGETMKDDPEGLAQLTNAFLEPMTDIVLAHGGTIDKYMGDCVMAFWGAPADDPHHARHAFEAAQAMLAAMDDIGPRLSAAFAGETPLAPIGISIGVNSGECLVGNVGSRRRFDYSVMGDAVNVASRLEGQCKVYDVPLLVGQETARRLGASSGLAEIARPVLRGRSERLSIFALASHIRQELAA